MKDYRKLDPGMGEGVANRTILRTNEYGEKETWGQVAHRVAYGNVSLDPSAQYAEYETLRNHIAQGRVLLSGRHLQHGDALQSDRPGEVFTNCSTAATSAIKKYLLLNGSGVGRSYDDILMVVDWSKQPFVIPTLGIVPEDANAKYLTPGTLHPDAEGTSFASKENALVRYPNAIVFNVPDSREGWAKAVEQVERMAYEERRDDVLILDFSRVRPKGSPIGGMQGRPSSGPVPLMTALCGMNLFRWKKDIDMWEQAMRVDHALAEVVMVGGARRAARIAIKHWKDPGIFKFINIKQQGGLWTANNSVAVDAEFWNSVEAAVTSGSKGLGVAAEHRHAHNVFMACVKAQYEHGSGEPGFVNADKLVQNDKGMEVYADGIFAGNSRFQLDAASAEMGKEIVRRLNNMPYKMGINPCGEIALLATGGYCIIGDVAPFFCDSLDQVEDAVRACARALIRTNQMEFLYGKETKRTNRIGVSLTGIHEFAWKFFGLTFRDLVDERRSSGFWSFLSRLAYECELEADRYSDELGVERPHTVVTIKPAGTTSKLFALTEGAHLPAMREYLRWVQFREDDPLVEECEAKGYPVKWNLKDSKGAPVYEGMAIVGYPTEPLICRLGIPQDKLVIAPEATMEEQFHYLMLLEKHWLGTERPNQISYTLKYDKDVVSFNDYVATILRYQPLVRCVTVMPASDWRMSKALFGYVPEEPIEHDEFLKLKAQIVETVVEDVDMDTLQCQSGACPI